jgi:hypothetical protein
MRGVEIDHSCDAFRMSRSNIADFLSGEGMPDQNRLLQLQRSMTASTSSPSRSAE